jgi:hypothetical protein
MRWGDSKADRAALDRHLTTEPEWRQTQPNNTFFECMESIARGGPCLVCGADWEEHFAAKGTKAQRRARFILHEEGCAYLAASNEEEFEERTGSMGPDNDPIFEPLVITNRAAMHTPDGKVGHGSIVTTLREDGTATYAWQPDPER